MEARIKNLQTILNDAWLVFEVAVANLYNRLNVATRQVAGTPRW